MFILPAGDAPGRQHFKANISPGAVPVLTCSLSPPPNTSEPCSLTQDGVPTLGSRRHSFSLHLSLAENVSFRQVAELPTHWHKAPLALSSILPVAEVWPGSGAGRPHLSRNEARGLRADQTTPRPSQTSNLAPRSPFTRELQSWPGARWKDHAPGFWRCTQYCQDFPVHCVLKGPVLPNLLQVNLPETDELQGGWETSGSPWHPTA